MNKHFIKILIVMIFLFNIRVFALEYKNGPIPEAGKYVKKSTVMSDGWYKSKEGKWFYYDNRSFPVSGWMFDETDNNYYYFDLNTCEMVIGWKEIDGNYYYFSEYSPRTVWYYDDNTARWYVREKNVKCLGALYINERTPDGRYVNEYGQLVK